MERLALLGGTPVIDKDTPVPQELFKWPIITPEDEEAALDVIRNNRYSGTDITIRFQEKFAAWQGREYAVAYCNGTMSLAAAMFAIGLQAGDEIICTTKTYWASITSAYLFGAVPVFCNVDDNLSMDPADLPRCLTPRTKAIMVVHYCGYPCDMDPIMAFAREHNLKVIEDVSHAQGGLYKGRKLGTFGDIAAMSLMSQKSFSAGELGILVTDRREYYERAIAYGHYERNKEPFISQCEDLKQYRCMPLGSVKGRPNQLCCAMAEGQLKHYDERIAEIRRAMNYFWDQLEGLPGIRPIRVDESTGSTMAGWYSPHGAYYPEELGGLPVGRFCEAVRAEINHSCSEGGNHCLHTHAYFQNFDLLGLGKPTRIAFAQEDVRKMDEALKPSEEKLCFSVPWFKKDIRSAIDLYVKGFRKVIENHQQLLEQSVDEDQYAGGRWFGMENEKK